MTEKLDPAIAKIRKIRGMAVRIAEQFKIDKAAVYQWKRVPPRRVLKVAEMLDMSPEDVRADIFKPE